jgi:ribosomal protein S6--L-glutamate ligase
MGKWSPPFKRDAIANLSYIHLGGTASIIKPTAEEKTRYKSSKAMDLKVACVDIIPVRPKVLYY